MRDPLSKSGVIVSRRLFLAGALASLGCAAPAGRSRVYLEDIGGVAGSRGDGRRNAGAIQAAFAAGAPEVRLRSGGLYNIAAFRIPSGRALIGDGGAPATLRLDPGAFTNRDPLAKTGSDVLAIEMSGETTGALRPAAASRVENIRILWDGPDGRALRFIRASNVRDLVLSGLVLEGLGVGRGLVLNSLSGDWRVEDCSFRKFHADVDLGPGSQSTAIEIDDDRVAGGSVGGRIVNASAQDIEFGPALLAARGDQTDFLNVGIEAKGLSILNATGRNVGEMIDCWGDEVTIVSPQLELARLFGIKFLHGAQRNRVVGGRVRGFGRAGVVFAGSRTRARDTAFNDVDRFDVSDGNYRGDWNEGSAAVLMEAATGSVGIYRDNVVHGCRLDPGAAAYAVRDGDSRGVGNVVRDVTASPGRRGLSALGSTRSLSLEIAG